MTPKARITVFVLIAFITLYFAHIINFNNIKTSKHKQELSIKDAQPFGEIIEYRINFAVQYEWIEITPHPFSPSHISIKYDCAARQITEIFYMNGPLLLLEEDGEVTYTEGSERMPNQRFVDYQSFFNQALKIRDRLQSRYQKIINQAENEYLQFWLKAAEQLEAAPLAPK